MTGRLIAGVFFLLTGALFFLEYLEVVPLRATAIVALLLIAAGVALIVGRPRRDTD